MFYIILFDVFFLFKTERAIHIYYERLLDTKYSNTDLPVVQTRLQIFVTKKRELPSTILHDWLPWVLEQPRFTWLIRDTGSNHFYKTSW